MSRERDFWSRRRAAVAAEEAARPEPAPATAPDPTPDLVDDRPEDEVLADLDLPVPETVASGEDLRKFMAKAVPAYLRRRAMRALWTSNPVLACLDGLNDYDGDYTNAATDAPGVKTAYRVGQGLRAHVEALAKASPEADPDDTGAAVAENISEQEPEPETPRTDEPAAPRVADADTADEEQTSPRPRRMAFQFDRETT